MHGYNIARPRLQAVCAVENADEPDQLVEQHVLSQDTLMQTATRSGYVTVEEYLAAEAASEIRHEYLGGLIYAMAGETRDHNTIALNVASLLRERLKAGPCKVYMGSVRVNFFLRNDEYYYYPDIVVTCDKQDIDKRFVRHPQLIIEVLSESTERVDRREKFFAYTSIATLEEYLLISQEPREVTIFRRVQDWKAEKFVGLEASVTFGSLNFAVPLSTIYEGV